jgi:hypothetical protein
VTSGLPNFANCNLAKNMAFGITALQIALKIISSICLQITPQQVLEIQQTAFLYHKIYNEDFI